MNQININPISVQELHKQRYQNRKQYKDMSEPQIISKIKKENKEYLQSYNRPDEKKS